MSDALSQCEQFLSAIFEPTDMIEFRTLKPVFKDWSTTAGLSAVVVKLQSLNGKGAQVYFGANPRKRSVSRRSLASPCRVVSSPTSTVA